MDIAALVVGIAALVAAAWVGFRQVRLQARVTSIEVARRAEELEGRKAAEIRITREESEHGFYVILTNHGEATARDIQFDAWSNGDPSNSVMIGIKETMPRLYPGDPIRLLASPTMGHRIPYEYELHWVDDRGPQSKASHL